MLNPIIPRRFIGPVPKLVDLAIENADLSNRIKWTQSVHSWITDKIISRSVKGDSILFCADEIGIVCTRNSFRVKLKVINKDQISIVSKTNGNGEPSICVQFHCDAKDLQDSAATYNFPIIDSCCVATYQGEKAKFAVENLIRRFYGYAEVK